MTVGELKIRLADVDDNRLVVLSADREGNAYSPLDGGWTAAYVAKSTDAGSVGLECLTQADADWGYTNEDVIADGVPAFVLMPIG